MKPPNTLFKLMGRSLFKETRCFLCGVTLTDKNRSDEDVFPKWLQRKYDLWNHKITLINGTTIPYRQLKIPCCQSCNTNFLSGLEKTVKSFHDSGNSSFVKIDRIKLFQWIGKIFYGSLYKELSLSTDRKKRRKRSIVDSKLLQNFRTLHFFLQSIRIPFDFVNFHPWTIFIVNTCKYDDVRDFDYYDGIANLTFAIRMGEVGIIACLEDAGVQERMYYNLFEKFKNIKLHPIQFLELLAMVSYRAFLQKSTPKYVSILPKNEKNGAVKVFHSLRVRFSEWNQREFAKVLARHWHQWQIPFERIFTPPDMALSFVYNADGTIRELDPNFEPVTFIVPSKN
ncbi:MAG TPA: hypothetical protein VI546_07010 [candidate division Zixibacteria bacterium]|nr:hypothetical protein [candidate division Zixibacteria bacterium]